MRCPKCGYNSFDHNLKCPKCDKDLASTRALLHLNLPQAGTANFFEAAKAGRDQPAPFDEEAQTPPETGGQAAAPFDAEERPERNQGLEAGGRDDAGEFGELLQSALDETESAGSVPSETGPDDFPEFSAAEPEMVAVEVMEEAAVPPDAVQPAVREPGAEPDRPPLARPYQKLLTVSPGHRELIGKLAQALKETGDIKDSD